MNKKTEDQILTELLHDKNEQPPKALDDIILNHAKASHSQNEPVTKKRDWKPWLAAASVVLALPLLWILTQNQELTKVPEPFPAPQVEQKPSVEIQGVIAESEAVMSDTDYHGDEQDQLEEQGKITVTGSRIMRAPEPDAAQEEPAAYLDVFEESVEAESKRSITGKEINYESLEANKTLLKNEFKAKKRTIKPSNMDPLMALEYAQFGRYLEEGQFDLADELLTEMQENWPDFDFEDMIYRLAEAEANSN